MAVFAHNESDRIVSCLEALRLSPLPPGTTCYLIANGCSDDTAEVAGKYALTVPWLKVVSLQIGDKSNAWNHFVHEIAPQADYYFFTDGDCQIDPQALQQLEQALDADDAVNAASGIPGLANQSLQVFRNAIMTHGGLAGNLYALSGSFVSRLRALSVRLPRGLIGDDSLVGALALWNLDRSSGWNHDRLRVVASATFRYESIAQSSLSDPMFYIRRLKRYSLRHFQNQLIRNRLKPAGPPVLPDHIEKIYLEAKDEELVPRKSLHHYLADRWAVSVIREIRDAGVRENKS